MKYLIFIFPLIFLSINQIAGQTTQPHNEGPILNGETAHINSKDNEDDQTALNETAKNSGEKELPMAIYEKAHRFFTTTKAFRNYTFQDTVNKINEANNWQAPPEFETKFAYNHSGYDHDDQPVWVAAVGKYDIREQMIKRPDAPQIFTQYLFQASLRIFMSMVAKDKPGKEIRRAFLIADAADIDTSQAFHIPTSTFLRNLAETYGDFYASGLGRCVIFNTTPSQKLVFPALKPTLGETYDRIEVFASDKDEWQAALRKQLPLSAIPAWYGGAQDYKPTQVFG